MKYVFIILCLSLSHSLLSQDSHAEVEQIIKTLFQGMQEGDSSKVHSTFDDETRMFSSSITDKEEVKLRTGNLQSFLNAVGTPHDAIWDERISDLTIQVDDNLAQAWMQYSFYLDGKFSHCGVNAMQLVRQKGDWKIIQIIDTRKKKCDH